MKQCPKVSIVIPVYNVMEYLPQCMESVLAQTLQEIEILCGDGGSTDGSLELLQQYAKKDARIRIISKEGSGYGQSMNDCMALSQGEYIGIVESDDFVAETMFQRLYEQAKATKADIVKSDFYCFVEQAGQMQAWKTNIGLSRRFYRRVFCPAEELRAFRCVLNTWSGIYRRDFLETYQIRHNESAGGSFQDNGFWFQTFAFAKKVCFLPESFYYYRQDNPNSSIHHAGKVFAICKEYDFIQKQLLKQEFVSPSVMQAFWAAKFGAYSYALFRIAPEFRLAFLEQMQIDFQGAETGAMNGRERKIVAIIQKDPLAYLKTVEEEEERKGILRLLKKVRGGYWCLLEHGFGFTLGKMKEKQILDKI